MEPSSSLAAKSLAAEDGEIRDGEEWNAWSGGDDERRKSKYNLDDNPEIDAADVRRESSTPSPRRAQRGTRRGATLTTTDDLQEEALRHKNISLAHLLHFWRKFDGQGKLRPDMTCAEVVKEIIIPETKEQQGCFIDTLMASPKPPETIVVHWMGLAFHELVLAVGRHACGGILNRETAEKRFFGGTGQLSTSDLEKTYWICMFAANHHQTTAECNPLSKPAIYGRICRSMSSALVVLDPALEVFSRSWCLMELREAVEASCSIEFGGQIDRRFRTEEAKPPGLEQSQTLEPDDKDRVLSFVRGQDGGIAAFDEALQDRCKRGVQHVVWREVLPEGDRDEIRSFIDLGFDVANAQVNRNETSLMWACQFGSLELVKTLLDCQADVNAKAQGGWTALHQVVQLGNEATVRTLIDRNADINVAAQNGRTPIMEAAERGYTTIAELLLDAGADITAEDAAGHAAAHFAVQYRGERMDLARRLGYTMEMERRMSALGRIGPLKAR